MTALMHNLALEDSPCSSCPSSVCSRSGMARRSEARANCSTRMSDSAAAGFNSKATWFGI
jgi:hypothetical protein